MHKFLSAAGAGKPDREDAEIVAVYPVELAQRQGACAASYLNSIARPVIFLDEPVLVSGEAGGVWRLVKAVAAGGAHPAADIEGHRRQIVEIFPIDDLALRVIGEGEREIMREGQLADGAALRGGERRGADEIPRSRRDEALRVFDLLCVLPSGGVVEVEIGADVEM